MEPMDSLLTARQLQDLLQVDRITIYRMLNDGRLKGFKVGGQWRFSRQAVQRWLQDQQATLGVNEDPVPAGALQPSSQSLPLGCIQAIQDIFAEALGVGAVTTAIDGSPLTTISNSCEFCTLIQSTEEGRRRCTASWQTAAAGRRDDPPQAAACHAGLNYVWGCIELRDAFVAATFAGQYLYQPAQKQRVEQQLAELSMATGLDAGRLRNALASVPVLDRDKQHQVPRLLMKATDTFSEIGEERLSLLERLRRIAEMTQVQDT